MYTPIRSTFILTLSIVESFMKYQTNYANYLPLKNEEK